jgi:hypothetical protein
MFRAKSLTSCWKSNPELLKEKNYLQNNLNFMGGGGRSFA